MTVGRLYSEMDFVRTFCGLPDFLRTVCGPFQPRFTPWQAVRQACVDSVYAVRQRRPFCSSSGCLAPVEDAVHLRKPVVPYGRLLSQQPPRLFNGHDLIRPRHHLV
jgi:hypothetical protein